MSDDSKNSLVGQWQGVITKGNQTKALCVLSVESDRPGLGEFLILPNGNRSETRLPYLTVTGRITKTEDGFRFEGDSLRSHSLNSHPLTCEEQSVVLSWTRKTLVFA